jgi:hypothetical protein
LVSYNLSFFENNIKPPFVEAARIEQAVDSQQCIFFLERDYSAYFKFVGKFVARGEKFFWSVNQQNLQVPGLGASGGWVSMYQIEYVPNGKISV